MTPLEIDFMLHYYCRADDWRAGDHSAPAVQDLLHRFISDDFITHANFHVERFEDGTLKARYKLTDKGMAYVHALMAVPAPVQIWTVPAMAEFRYPQVGAVPHE